MRYRQRAAPFILAGAIGGSLLSAVSITSILLIVGGREGLVPRWLLVLVLIIGGLVTGLLAGLGGWLGAGAGGLVSGSRWGAAVGGAVLSAAAAWVGLVLGSFPIGYWWYVLPSSALLFGVLGFLRGSPHPSS